MKNNIRVLVACVVLLPQVLTYFALRNSYMGGVITTDLLRYKSITSNSLPCLLIISSKSFVLSQTVAVLSFGCTPIFLPIKSLSKKNLTERSLLFSSPNGVTEPLVSASLSVKSSPEAKLSLRVLCFA